MRSFVFLTSGCEESHTRLYGAGGEPHLEKAKTFIRIRRLEGLPPAAISSRSCNAVTTGRGPQAPETQTDSRIGPCFVPSLPQAYPEGPTRLQGFCRRRPDKVARFSRQGKRKKGELTKEKTPNNRPHFYQTDYAIHRRLPTPCAVFLIPEFCSLCA